MERAYLASSLVLSALVCALGIAMLVSTLVRGGGPFALGTVLGLTLAVLGAARLWLARRGNPGAGR